MTGTLIDLNGGNDVYPMQAYTKHDKNLDLMKLRTTSSEMVLAVYFIFEGTVKELLYYRSYCEMLYIIQGNADY